MSNPRIFRCLTTPPEIIRLAVKRDVRQPLPSRSVDAMRAHQHRRWHRDDVFVKINGVKHCFWRAMDSEAKDSKASSQCAAI